MKRTSAALTLLLLLLPALPPAGAAGASEHWDSERTLRADLAVPALVDLHIGPGVNINFEPDLNASVFSPIFLNISGGLEVCGTADRPAVFFASNESLFTQGDIGGRMTLAGNGDSGQIAVRNCSFQNLVVEMDGTGGQFQDCRFDSCYLYIQDSPLRFENCSFLRSAMSLYSIATVDQTQLYRCTFDTSRQERWDPFWQYFEDTPAIKVSGYAGIDDCTISGYGAGIQSMSGLPVITGCRIRDCTYGIYLFTTDPADTPLVDGCVIHNCSQCAIEAVGNLHLQNCTLSDSVYGLELLKDAPDSSPNWSLSGNRIFGNEKYGIYLIGVELPPGDTRFDDGAGVTNQQGRVLKQGSLLVEISTRGTASLSHILVNITDAFGTLATGRLSDTTPVYSDLTEYTVDNSGQRKDYYPYNVRAEWNGIFCETVVSAGTLKVILILEVLPDLVPFEITLDPRSPKGGDWVVISCMVNNPGPTPSSRVLVGARSNSTVRARDWKARPGSHTMTVQLDPQNTLQENDETNNNLTFNFTVGEAPQKPIAASNIVYAGAATVVILVLACAGGYLVLRRRNRARGV
jgi:hypothetical protein